MAIINGRRVVNVPGGGVTGTQLIDELGPARGRRAVIHRGGLQFETIQPHRHYSPRELVDKKGQPVKVDTIPDRTKGGFGGPRDPLSRQIIAEQVYDTAEHLFKEGIEFDEDNADWMVAPKYYLPPNWRHVARSTALLIAFPTEYPALPPIGFYLMADLPQSPNGHLYGQAYHDAWKAPLEHGWKWYCAYLAPGAWQPAPVRRSGDWRRGDNLWTYLTLVNETLAGQD